jgi:hypothetical protein
LLFIKHFLVIGSCHVQTDIRGGLKSRNRGHLAAGTVIMIKSDYAGQDRCYIIGILANNT